MARKTNHLADSLETDDSGGVLSGFLAEEEDLDRRALWRLGSWGVGAVGAVVIAVMANQTQFGWRRDQMAAADLSQRTLQMQNIANQTEREARRLASAVDTLNSDRDRLYSRVTSLEQGLDSVTGSIARQNSAARSSAPASPLGEPPAAQNPVPAVAPLTTPDKPAANPALSEAAPKADKIESKKEASKSGTAKSDSAKFEASKPEAAKADIAEIAKPEPAKPEPAKTETTKADAARAEMATPATPLIASKSIMAPPDPSAGKLIEPARPLSLSPVVASPLPEVMAAAPATDAEADEETGPKIAIQRTQFGVDLGAANSVSGLRVLWRTLLNSKSNASLATLRPIMAIKEGSNGRGMQLRLVAGPLNDAGAAAKICAALTENRRSCETTIYDGQRLSLTVDDPTPAPTARPAPRRRIVPRRAAATMMEEKKPEISTTASMSGWFGKKGQ